MSIKLGTSSTAEPALFVGLILVKTGHPDRKKVLKKSREGQHVRMVTCSCCSGVVDLSEIRIRGEG